MSFLKRFGNIIKKRKKTSPIKKAHESVEPRMANKLSPKSRQTPEGSRRVLKTPAHERLERMKTLTPREWEVYEHLIHGMKMREVAELLGITYPTVNFHCQGLYKKLGINARAQLFAQYSMLDDNDVKKAREAEK